MSALLAKTCTKCREAKPLEAFYFRWRSSDRASRCKRCMNDYQIEANRLRRSGTPRPKKTAEERFFAKVKKTSGCWLWAGARHRQGYGLFNNHSRPGKSVLAHRFSYELARGEIPDGLVIDHLCKNTSCVNPDHLEAVTQTENIARGTSPSAPFIRRTS